ncbi:MAG TPA: quinone-dependent dihydroorotate dehydrogenase, partial [Nevskiaceae bacterium]
VDQGAPDRHAMDIYPLLRAVLFCMDAERSHRLAMAGMARAPRLFGCAGGRAVDDPADMMGLHFRNRIGLAAGLDKDGVAIEALDRMGFGFIEVGTVTPRAQPGNPRPRMFRLPRHRALINRMGFNNAGVDALVRRIESARRHCPLGVNIGKNRDTPLDHALDDYLLCLRRVYGVADYVVVNVSSPNTAGLRDLQRGSRFRDLFGRVAAECRRLADVHGMRRPLLVKLSPDLPAAELRETALRARELGAAGVIVTNTTITRPGLESELMATEPGGLSGRPLRAAALAALRELRSSLGAEFALIGVGGIMGRDDALERRTAGADLIQLYTGLVYRGPRLVRECAQALADFPDALAK